MKYALFIFLLITSPCVRAQSDIKTYRPFVEEGKEWTVGYYRYFDSEPFRYIDFVLSGDTIIADIACKKMLEHYYSADGTDEQVAYAGALTETGGRVFFYPPSSTVSGLIYDFTSSTGNVLTLMDAARQTPSVSASGVEAHVIDERYVENGRSRLHCISIQDDYDTERTDVLTYTLWIDGIGGIKGPLSNCHTNTQGLGAVLISCRVDDREIYNEEQNPTHVVHDILSGVSFTTIHQSVNSKFFDLSGRRLAAPPARGAYIKDGEVRLNK